MKLDHIFGFLVPKDRKFFPLFTQAAENMVLTSELLLKLIRENDIEKREEYIAAIKETEHVGDAITRTLLDELNATFITPFDREDIHELAQTMDSVVDYIHTTSKRIHHYKVNILPAEFVIIADLIHDANKEILNIVRGMKDVGGLMKYKQACIRISDIESDVDDIYQAYLADLFENEPNAIDLIKKRDILASLEKAIDKCDDVGDVFSSIMVKLS
jgi:predicted phosphate transport protein (TIGR00153 family)